MLLMFQNSSRAVSREELLDYIWGCEESVKTRAADDMVKRLRKNLLACYSNVYIQTLWG